MRNVLIVIGVFLVTTILAPCMWYLWIYAGSGNANFFYAITLVYNAAQVSPSSFDHVFIYLIHLLIYCYFLFFCFIIVFFLMQEVNIYLISWNKGLMNLRKIAVARNV